MKRLSANGEYVKNQAVDNLHIWEIQPLKLRCAAKQGFEMGGQVVTCNCVGHDGWTAGSESHYPP